MGVKALPQDHPKSLVRPWSCEQSPLLAGAQPPLPCPCPPRPRSFIQPSLARPHGPHSSALRFFFSLFFPSPPQQELTLLPGPGWEAQPGQGRTRWDEPSPPQLHKAGPSRIQTALKPLLKGLGGRLTFRQGCSLPLSPAS